MRRAALPLIALLAVSAFAARAADTYPLRHKPVKGEERTLVLKVEGKFSEVSIVSEAEIASKITDVADDGAYTEEQTTKATKITVNGEDGPLGDAETKTIKYDAKGREIDAKESPEGSDPFSLAFDYEANAPVAIGGKYRPEKSKDSEPDRLEWTLVGKETVDGAETLHLSAKGDGPKGAKIESDIYLDPNTSLLVKGVAKVTGVEQEGVPGTGEFNVTVTAKK